MGAFEQAAEARIAAAAKAKNSYTAATGRDVPTGTPFGQAGSVVPASTLSGVGQYQTVDPGFTKVSYNKLDPSTKQTIAANAASNNMTPQEYYEGRGGVNKAGYFGDSWSAQANLTDAEYAQVMAESKAKGLTGTAIGEAITAATDAKRTKSGLPALSGGSADTGTGTGTGTGTSGTGTPEQKAARQSAFDLLKLQFDEYGLGALVEPLRGLIQEGVSPSEFAVRLRQTDPYKKRFAANAARIASGLRALSEAEYINLEDGYQTIMRNYGLPATYYTKGELGRQEGFEKFIAGDVSPAELEDRISIAQKRVIDAAPGVTEALKQFYPDIKNADILAYTLDPAQGLASIQKKVLAAEIGGAALGAKTVSGTALETSAARAEELARYGVTAETAQKGYGAIGGGLERGRQLSSIYQQPDYNQAVAEEEIFNLPGQAQAGEKRKKIIGLEKATFGGQTGVTSGALNQNRAGSY
jgi:hypothetical protein